MTSQSNGNIFIRNRSERIVTVVTPEGKLMNVTYVVTCTICGQEFKGKSLITARKAHIAHIISEHRFVIDDYLSKFKDDIQEVNKRCQP